MAKNKKVTNTMEKATDVTKELKSELTPEQQAANAEAALKQAEEEAQLKAGAEEEAKQAALEAEEAATKQKAEEEAKRLEEQAKQEALAKLANDAKQQAPQNAVANAISEQMVVSIQELKTRSADAVACAKRLGAMMRIFDNVSKLEDGKDFVATMDVLLGCVKAESAEGGVFSAERAHQYTAQAPVPVAMINRYQVMLNWMQVIINHIDDGSEVDYTTDFDDETLQEAFVGNTGERMVAYAHRICNIA